MRKISAYKPVPPVKPPHLIRPHLLARPPVPPPSTSPSPSYPCLPPTPSPSPSPFPCVAPTPSSTTSMTPSTIPSLEGVRGSIVKLLGEREQYRKENIMLKHCRQQCEQLHQENLLLRQELLRLRGDRHGEGGEGKEGKEE